MGEVEEEEEGYLIQRHKNSPFALPPLSEGKERGGQGETDLHVRGLLPLSARLSSRARPILLLAGLGGRWARNSAVRGTDGRTVGPTANGRG